MQPSRWALDCKGEGGFKGGSMYICTDDRCVCGSPEQFVWRVGGEGCRGVRLAASTPGPKPLYLKGRSSSAAAWTSTAAVRI